MNQNSVNMGKTGQGSVAFFVRSNAGTSSHISAERCVFIGGSTANNGSNECVEIQGASDTTLAQGPTTGFISFKDCEVGAPTYTQNGFTYVDDYYGSGGNVYVNFLEFLRTVFVKSTMDSSGQNTLFGFVRYLDCDISQTSTTWGGFQTASLDWRTPGDAEDITSTLSLGTANTITNSDGCDEMILVANNGTASVSITIDGVSISATSGAFILRVGNTLVITLGSTGIVPTVKKVGL